MEKAVEAMCRLKKKATSGTQMTSTVIALVSMQHTQYKPM